MALDGKNYALSQGYDATSDEVLTIFHILLSLKSIVKELAGV